MLHRRPAVGRGLAPTRRAPQKWLIMNPALLADTAKQTINYSRN
jgi:hypothetical protein